MERRKQLRRHEQEQRESVARQLTIFGDVGDADPEQDLVRQRRAEIRARVQRRLEKVSPLHRRVQALADAGDVAIRMATVGSGSAAVATAPEMAEMHDTPDRMDAYGVAEPPDTADKSDEPDMAGPNVASRTTRPRTSRAARPNRNVGSDTIEHFELASPGERLLAGLIDFGFLTLMLLGLAYLTTNLASQPLQALPRPALAALGCVGFLLAVGYLLFFWSLSGQTLGKLLTSSRVVDPLGQPLGFSRALVRTLGIGLSLLPLGAGFVGLWSDIGRRAWHDRLASTKVVRM
ncbi:MAG: RDD family protein [Vicinamibacteria bacterium]